MTDKKTGENAFLAIGGRKVEPMDEGSLKAMRESKAPVVIQISPQTPQEEAQDIIFERLRGNKRLERFLRFWLSFRLREASRLAGGKLVVGEAKAAAKKAVWAIAVFASNNEERFTKIPPIRSCLPGEHTWEPKRYDDHLTGEIEIFTICSTCGDQRFECFECGSEIVNDQCEYCERAKNGNRT